MRSHDDLNQIFASQYDVLRGLARQELRRLPPGQTLSATALVHEAFIRILKKSGEMSLTEEDVLRLLSYAIRDVLVSYVRSKMRSQRRQAEYVYIVDTLVNTKVDEPIGEDILRLDVALQKLEETDTELAEIVIMRVFGELQMEQIATVTGSSLSTVNRRWQAAKTWLRVSLAD